MDKSLAVSSLAKNSYLEHFPINWFFFCELLVVPLMNSNGKQTKAVRKWTALVFRCTQPFHVLWTFAKVLSKHTWAVCLYWLAKSLSSPSNFISECDTESDNCVIENHWKSFFFPLQTNVPAKMHYKPIISSSCRAGFPRVNISTSPRQYLMRYLEVASTHQQLWSNLSGINDLSQLHEYTESFSLRFCLLHRKHYIAARPSVLS